MGSSWDVEGSAASITADSTSSPAIWLPGLAASSVLLALRALLLLVRLMLTRTLPLVSR